MDKNGFKILLCWANALMFSSVVWFAIAVWLWRVL